MLKLPVLIDRLSDMEQDQMTDRRASIHGRGSDQLTGQAQVLQVSNETWIQLTPHQKMRRLNRLFTFKSKSSASVTSNDGTLTVPIVTNVARKPGQMKRLVNSKQQQYMASVQR